jgi:flavin-dependent dehydrogenase
MSYDVIVVGGRLAGAATGMLLARQGLKVLIVDRTHFPSDTLSSHQLQPPGVARLRRWGLLDRLDATGTPPVRDVRFDVNGVVIAGRYPDVAGSGALYSPRREVLDTLLVQAAREAGAEVREDTIVDELLMSEGRVRGIRSRRKGSSTATDDTAALIVGADGKHSMVAKTVGAPSRRSRTARSLGFYCYWQDVEILAGELYSRDRRVAGAWPTDQGMVVTYVGWPASEFDAFRADPAGHVLRTLDACGTLGARVRAGRRVGPVRGTSDLPNEIRLSSGPGWALAGDAGLVMDSITGQGMGHALRDADLLSDAIITGLGSGRLDRSLARYAKQRDAETKAMFDFTVRLASFPPPTPAERTMFAAIAERPEETSQLLGALAGSVPITSLFSPRRLMSLTGVRGFAALARSQLRPVTPRPAPVEELPDRVA